jgi:hypothetical protein
MKIRFEDNIVYLKEEKKNCHNKKEKSFYFIVETLRKNMKVYYGNSRKGYIKKKIIRETR